VTCNFDKTVTNNVAFRVLLCFLRRLIHLLEEEDLVIPMGNISNEEQELEEIENLEREDIEKVGVDIEDTSGIAPWTKQITIRGLITSILLGIVYSIIVMKLNLTTGLVPNLNVSVALLGFVFIKLWTKILEKANFVATPFTRQENTLIQTCAVACYSASFGGEFFVLFLIQYICLRLKINWRTLVIQSSAKK
jgi:hypothetical protein